VVLHQLHYTINWLKNSHHFFIQSEVHVKPKPITTCSHTLSHALRQLRVITSSFDWVVWVLHVWHSIEIQSTVHHLLQSFDSCVAWTAIGFLNFIIFKSQVFLWKITNSNILRFDKSTIFLWTGEISLSSNTERKRIY